jgi:hypothetical protein
MVSGETIPILKERWVKLSLGLMTWVYVSEITIKFILGLDVLCTHEASMDLGSCVLWLGDEEVPLWLPGVQLCSSFHTKGNSGMVATRCARVTAAWLEGYLEVADSPADRVPGLPTEL